jgi:molecular chaperone GrpE
LRQRPPPRQLGSFRRYRACTRGCATDNTPAKRMMMDNYRVGEDQLPSRDDADPAAMAEGDAQLDVDPPNVNEVQQPDESITGDAPEADEGGDGSLEQLQRQFATLNDRHLRLAAEFDNYRRRSERERAELHTRAQGELATRLLDALDDLERVTHYAEAAPDSLLPGVQLVERKLRQSLQSAGLEAIDPAGERFDPNSMEAVAMVAAESAADDDVVSDVFQRGYAFKGALLRPARVRVKKHGI